MSERSGGGFLVQTKTEVASESLPVAPFAHPASPLAPSHSYTSWTPSRAGGTQASITKLIELCSNLEYKRQCCVVVQTSLRDRDLRHLKSVITKKSLTENIDNARQNVSDLNVNYVRGKRKLDSDGRQPPEAWGLHREGRANLCSTSGDGRGPEKEWGHVAEAWTRQLASARSISTFDALVEIAKKPIENTLRPYETREEEEDTMSLMSNLDNITACNPNRQNEFLSDEQELIIERVLEGVEYLCKISGAHSVNSFELGKACKS
ncbi:hypothetical protein MSG28_001673 [Choristoneura fumiferana]|uniref:Uncharacterized protein n=1 Tax=Choristoneura fumiferana TaxID=7141 RepID=A0ACC0KVJ7_CHOFU|nr:hypothetical protein MSG28_001673 [Choristoneura fumiferana]